jgi:porin
MKTLVIALTALAATGCMAGVAPGGRDGGAAPGEPTLRIAALEEPASGVGFAGDGALMRPDGGSADAAPDAARLERFGEHRSCRPACRQFTRRAKLTGDWWGRRSCWAERGVTFSGRVTQFFFGIDGGINAPVPPVLGQGDATSYTGRGQYEVRFDLGKLTRLRAGSVLIGFEHWWGEYGNVGLKTGAFAPAVFPASLPTSPEHEGVPRLTNLIWTQPLSKSFAFFIGKKDVLGALDQDDFAGGDGTEQFMNQALIANPALLLGMPYTSFTVGVGLKTAWGGVGAFIYDAKDRSDEFLELDTLFSEGFILGGEVKRKSCIFGLPGQHHVGAIWKHVDMPDLAFSEPPPGEYPYPTAPGVPTKPDSYTLYYGFDQYVQVCAADKTRGWGVFGRASVSDGNPTPLQYFLSAGIGGFNPYTYGRGDRFGLGFYYIDASDEFGPVPRALVGPEDGYGVEAFYNFKATRWLEISPDVQLMQPGGRGISEAALLVGLRVNIEL